MFTYEEAAAEDLFVVLQAVMGTLRELYDDAQGGAQSIESVAIEAGVASRLDLSLTELREDRWHMLLCAACDLLADQGLIEDPSRN